MNRLLLKGFFVLTLIGGGNTLIISAQEASIGSTVYPTLAEAFAAA